VGLNDQRSRTWPGAVAQRQIIRMNLKYQAGSIGGAGYQLQSQA
jgi:hypothetical protein